MSFFSTLDRKVIQIGRDLTRPLLQPPAQSRASYEVRPACLGLYHFLLIFFSTASSDCAVSFRRQGFAPASSFSPDFENICCFSMAHHINIVRSMANRCCYLYSSKCYSSCKMAEVEKIKKAQIGGIYNPGSDSTSCPA